MIPDTVYDALDKILPGHTVPAEGRGQPVQFPGLLRPRTDAPAPKSARRSEVLTFNSGGSGARPGWTA
jgi:N-methylhydantoinase B